MKNTIETLSESNDEVLNEMAHELTGQCWHDLKILTYALGCSKCGKKSNGVYRHQNDYCTSIADAWNLVKFGESKGIHLHLDNRFREVNFGKFGRIERILEYVKFNEFKEVPRAITIAFILAMGGI